MTPESTARGVAIRPLLRTAIPNCWTLGRSGPLFGPWAVRARLLDPGPFGPIGWAYPYSRDSGHVPCQVGHVPCQVGPVPCQVGHVPCPGWACPMSRLGMSHVQGPILGPIWGPIFCLGPIWVPFGDPFLFGAYFGPFWSIMVYFGLFWSILVYYGLFWFILVHFVCWTPMRTLLAHNICYDCPC